jgi:1-phosphatidylinositol-3-phosphate 5-kinase
MKLSKESFTKVRPQLKRRPDLMDIREYVKVKIIPEGDLKECQYLNGVVFSKNLIHRRMRSHISKPKILLLNGALEYPQNIFLL